MLPNNMMENVEFYVIVRIFRIFTIYMENCKLFLIIDVEI